MYVNPRSTFLNFAVLNSRSVRNKTESIIDHVVENDIGLCTVTETWLNDADSVSIAQLSVAGYFLKNFSRQFSHLSGNILDLIITRSSDVVVLASPKATFPISDHFIIQCPIRFPRPALSYKELTFRKLKNIDIAEFSADVASSMLCASVHWDNIDALSDCFNMTLTDILDKHAPLKTRIMINRPKIPWFNDDIKQLKRKRRRLEKKALKTDLPGDWNNYHKVRNQYSALLKSARVNYYSNLIDQCAGDSRKLFPVVYSLSRLGNHLRRLFQSTMIP